MPPERVRVSPKSPVTRRVLVPSVKRNSSTAETVRALPPPFRSITSIELSEVLSNAVKYNRDGGRIEVVVEPARAGWTRIAVRDTGHGVSADGNIDAKERQALGQICQSLNLDINNFS